MTRAIACYVLSLLLFNLAACSSMQTVNIENAMAYSPPRGLDYGSLVEVRTLDGQRAKFRVTDIAPEGLGGKPGFFAYEDMESLKVEDPSGGQGEWTGILIGILGLAAVIALIDNADSVSVCSPGPCPAPDP